MFLKMAKSMTDDMPDVDIVGQIFTLSHWKLNENILICPYFYIVATVDMSVLSCVCL